MILTPAAKNGFIALAVLISVAGGLRLLAARAAEGTELRHHWDDTIGSTAQDPAGWLLFLGERQVSADATWNWRQLPDEARNIWASVNFELHLPYPSEPTGTDSGLPTYAEAAEAYEAMDVGEAAILIHAMRNALPVGTGKAGSSWSASSAKLVAMKPRLAAARTAYAQAHRTELDRLNAERAGPR